MPSHAALHGIRSISGEEMPTRRQHGTRWISTRAMFTRRLPATQRNIDSAAGVLLSTHRTAQTTISGTAAAASISYKAVGSGIQRAPATDFRERDRPWCRAICGRRVCFRDRHESVRQRVLPRSAARSQSCAPSAGRSAVTSVAASVNPYLTRGLLLDPATRG